MGNIEIRRPRQEDQAELHQFFNHVISETFANEGLSELVDDIEKEIVQKQKLLECDLESKGEERFFWIAVDTRENKIVGTIEYGASSELINICSNGELKDVVEIGTLFVHPDHQRKGIGTLLLNVIFITLQSRGITKFCLDSGYSNAQKIWKKKFGEPDYLLRDYWGTGSDHMIWKRQTSDMAIMFNKFL
ncbi:GNAT family acetyltransferase [Heyndrickxia shackletonii]|uniref:GNAT family acetyltransferase n=1 Tax=Heyndrickxia shackletonii TaxID=157838 RepID=A0A0Q3WYS5_9BACI|nr:GNAT family N-acetyltransferase [Heyndrickxia shackletonii]KQL54423.1 GNAT family acetyltransferase [Heyndrickxia shackletonii]NEY99143.1 GNAT family N-acetyltransferase [Heyndrickxia shackletonii]